MKLYGLKETVKVNLADSLRRFRYEDRARRLWVDALCINPVNHDERAQQVAMMAPIYANAVRTLVWVGEDSEHHDGAIMMTACRAINLDPPVDERVIREERTAWFTRPHRALDPILHLSASLETDDTVGSRSYNELKHLILPAARKFGARRYFARRWILQELFNAKSVEVHFGADKIE